MAAQNVTIAQNVTMLQLARAARANCNKVEFCYNLRGRPAQIVIIVTFCAGCPLFMKLAKKMTEFCFLIRYNARGLAKSDISQKITMVLSFFLSCLL